MLNLFVVSNKAGVPKIFIYDCCRGIDTDNFVKNEEKDDNTISKGSQKKKEEMIITVNSDMLFWYATVDYHQAFEKKSNDKKTNIGGFFLTETYHSPCILNNIPSTF